MHCVNKWLLQARLAKSLCLNETKYHVKQLCEVFLPKLKDAKIFSLVDAKDGFQQVKLTNERSYLTTFWTQFVKYRWLRMAFGLTSSPEVFQRRLQLALDGLDGIFFVADDILIIGRGETDEEARRDHDENLARLLQRAREQNLKLNEAKMRLHLTEIKYIGHDLSPEGVKAVPEKVSDSSSMATPTDSDQVRRFLGFTSYLAKFLPNLSTISEPLRCIIQKDVEFQWGQTQEDAFRKIKEVATSEQSLAYYDVKRPIVLQCDASTQGLGASLMQDGKPVAYVSRSLTKCEQKYAPIELECLAIVFACRKFDQYIYGHAEVTIHSDHKPLEACPIIPSTSQRDIDWTDFPLCDPRWTGGRDRLGRLTNVCQSQRAKIR